jgi:hypothetical protein
MLILEAPATSEAPTMEAMVALPSTLVLTLLFALYLQPSFIALLGPLVAAIYLVLREPPLDTSNGFVAGLVLLLAFPGLRLMLHHLDNPNGLGEDTYRRAVIPWSLVMLVIIAGSL